MRNAVLHLISNKSGGFGVSAFPSYSSYTPYTPTEAEEKIRTTLLINNASYYLINSMVAVYSFPEVLSEFRETSRTFQFNDLPRPTVGITGASYANTDTANFNIVNIPQTFPSASYFNWTIYYQDFETLGIKACDKNFIVPYSATSVTQGSTAYNLITADWPTELGIKAGFALDPGLSWSLNTTIQLYVPPVTFPYGKALDAVKYLSEFSTVLNTSGLATQYFSAQSDIEKYAILMLAIARPDLRNPITASNCN